MDSGVSYVCRQTAGHLFTSPFPWSNRPPHPTQPHPPPLPNEKDHVRSIIVGSSWPPAARLTFCQLDYKRKFSSTSAASIFSKDREMFFIFSAKHLQIKKLQMLPFTNKRHKCPLGYSGSSYLSLLSRIALPPFSCLSCLFCLLVPEMLVKIVNRIAVLSSPQMFTSVVIQEVVWSML